MVAGACGTSPDASDDPADAFVPEQVDAEAGDPDPAAGPDVEDSPDEPELEPGFVAVGSDQMLEAGLVWTSPDGLSWTRVAHDDAVFGSGDERLVMLSVAEGEEGLVAVGRDRDERAAAVWTRP